MESQMNYYPNYNNPQNYYLNYPYGNQFSSQPAGNMPPQYPQQPQPVQPVSLQSNLNGKIVDSEDVVRATEVPIGGYGIFPKADLSEIYIKSWNNNGTTSVLTFIPKPKEEPKPVLAEEVNLNNPNLMDEMLEHIHRLESKIDAILIKNAETPVQVTKPAPTATKKEVHF